MIHGDQDEHDKLTDRLVALEKEVDIALVQLLHQTVTQSAQAIVSVRWDA